MHIGRPRRADLDNTEIALAWISGMSHLDIATEFDCTTGTVSNRLREARRDLPDLPWDERGAKTPSGGANVKQYLDMKDGKIGESRVPEGSVIRSKRMRNR